MFVRSKWLGYRPKWPPKLRQEAKQMHLARRLRELRTAEVLEQRALAMGPQTVMLAKKTLVNQCGTAFWVQ
jgi:hypothetical protein